MPALRPLAAAGAALAAGFALAPAPADASPATERADAALERALDRVVRSRGGPPGVSALVQRGSRRTFRAAGVADLRTRRRIRATDHLRLASVSKAFSGAVVLALVQRGRLGLDDTIARRLPQLPAAWGAATVGQALGHRAGLPDFSRSPEFLAALRADPRRTLDSRSLWRFVADRPLTYPPGANYRYSNTDNVVAALFAEAATGERYETLLRDLVFRPLGLRRTSLPSGSRLPSPFVRGYEVPARGRPQDLSTVFGMSGVWAAGGIVSTPRDLNAFIRAYVGRRLFGRAVQARQLALAPGTSEPPGPGVNRAGMALFRYRTRCGTVYGHTGNIFGYTQFAAATLDGRRSVVVSANEQLSQTLKPTTWKRLRAAQERAVCAALAR